MAKKASETPPKKKKKADSLEEKVRVLTDIEHVLLRPDSYVGSVENAEFHRWYCTTPNGKMTLGHISYPPALLKIFDEILVNALDNTQRKGIKMTRIDVVVDPERNYISVRNDGRGISHAKIKEYNAHIPELLFGRMLTGTNFDDDEKKTTGGRNGEGAKLAVIYSTLARINTARAKKVYRQDFCNNLSEIKKPTIKPYDGDDFTQFEFYPDLKKFGLEKLEDGVVNAMLTRVVDSAGIYPKLVVTYNGEQIKIPNLCSYASRFMNAGDPMEVDTEDSSRKCRGCGRDHNNEMLYLKSGDRWQVIVAPSPQRHFEHVTFVNGIHTSDGGTHLRHVLNEILNPIVTHFAKKATVSADKIARWRYDTERAVKSHMFIMITSLIDNPSFSSQTKERLTSHEKKFGTAFSLPTKTGKELLKLPILDSIKRTMKAQEMREMKKSDGKKTRTMLDIPKLEDANLAGTSQSGDCTLILTEGDSAKATAVSGLSVVGRDKYGVFPLRGKLLNVRDARPEQIMSNEEIKNIKRIMGLQTGVKYTSANKLRYGHVMIMADQDHDGSHIKGLLLNLFHVFWPELLQIPGFMQQFITPIIKARRGDAERLFYSIPDYEKWTRETEDKASWKIKYYKGLGTSDDAEARSYFADIDRHTMDFLWCNDTDRLLSLAFSKAEADGRKEWILRHDPVEVGTVDYAQPSIDHGDFVNKELILFSIADNHRSIPSVMDGLKPGQRKILYGAFKRKLQNEVKVSTLAGYVMENCAYHHGDAALQGTIVGMAATYVGTNNVNLLVPAGQFGTRFAGGKDAASARYIFTRLEPIARYLFPEIDDHVLTYTYDDGQKVEPQWYAPILPMILVNGTEGIGTGWSTSVPMFNPSDIITNIRRRMANEPLKVLHPWYHGFKGSITHNNPERTSYTIMGKVERTDDCVYTITELPIGKWTHAYKEWLQKQAGDAPAAGTAAVGTKKRRKKASFIKLVDLRERHTITHVEFEVVVTEESDMDLVMMSEDKSLEELFELKSSINLTNMTLFTPEGKIQKFRSANEILRMFYSHRIKLYQKRLEYQRRILAAEMEELNNKIRFIRELLSDDEGVKLDLRNRKRNDIISDLKQRGYTQIHTENDTFDGYGYLRSMHIMSVSEEDVARLQKSVDNKRAELAKANAQTPEGAWSYDLAMFEEVYEEMCAARKAISQNKPVPAPPSAQKRKRVPGASTKAKKSNTVQNES